MTEKETFYSGPAQVYLQGVNALSLYKAPSSRSVSYYLGAPSSAIRLRDYRRLPLQAVRGGLLAGSFTRFASLFNGPARVEILSTPEGAEIQLREAEPDDRLKTELRQSPGESPDQPGGQTLWLGVLDNGWVPTPDAQWEILRPLGGERTAFAALVCG